MIWHALAVLAVGTVLTGCVGDERPVVLVASSLRAALDGKGPDVRMAFASSGAIATQVRQGAAADAVVVADPAISAALAGEDRVEPPVTVARNRIAVLVPRGNPEGIQALADLAQPGRRVAVAADGVPLGEYTATVLRRARAQAIQRNVVTNEPDAAGVVGKVSLGEVDAGIGYASDLTSGRVAGFVLPDAIQVDVRYQAAVVRDAGHRRGAQEFVAWLTGRQGRAALTAAGFAAP